MSTFLQLPRELRDRIYRNLISVQHTKTPKSAHDACRSASSSYNWNIDPTILRVNRQMNEEVRDIMARENEFVVIERAAKQLEQVESDFEEEDVRIMKFNVTLWPGKPTKKVTVQERLRIRFWKDEAASGELYVLLLEELQDFCVRLSLFRHKKGSHGLLGIHACVLFGEVLPGNTWTKQAREDALVSSMSKLRFLATLKVMCDPSDRIRSLEEQATRRSFDGFLITSTAHEMIQAGDHARDLHHYHVATAYYQRASDYFHHFNDEEYLSIFSHPADPLAMEFTIMQHRALNWIEDNNFEDALGAAELALQMAQQLFAIGAHTSGGPETDAQGRVKKGRLRAWICQCIKDGAERYEQRIKSEDIGRCYYYRSIAGHCVYGDDATEEADEDKLTAIGCCVVSETATDEENIPKELMELDVRIMKSLLRDGEEPDDDDEWEDVSEGEVHYNWVMR